MKLEILPNVDIIQVLEYTVHMIWQEMSENGATTHLLKIIVEDTFWGDHTGKKDFPIYRPKQLILLIDQILTDFAASTIPRMMYRTRKK